MKLLTSLSAMATILIFPAMDAHAQTDIKLFPKADKSTPDLNTKIDTPRLYFPIDSNRYLIDSSKFVKKPNYNEYNQPVDIPNSFKSVQSTSIPMRVKKIPLAVPENKKD